MSRELIAESVGGIAYLIEENGLIGFHRFTREQREYAYKNTATTAGVCFEFETDSRAVRLAGMIRATTVSFSYAFDLLVNGAREAAPTVQRIVNKAIDGEVFRARLGALRDAFEPDFITVAYGTNDWNKLTKAKFEANCLGFYENLSRSYPNTRIFAITPLWRGDFEDETHGCSFAHIEDFICRVADGAANVTPLRGFDFVPHEPELFADGFLNDIHA